MNNQNEIEVRKAVAEARALINRYGQDDPRSMLAIIHAVNLNDPEFMDKTLRESGIDLPAAEFVDDEGNPLWTSQAIADSVGVPHEQVIRDIEVLADAGQLSPVQSSHRIQ